MAALLGKERAVFLPTGTLANNLAIRTLAGGAGRAVVQDDSHIHLDSGDCVQPLSGVTLMPLGEGRATFTAEEPERLLDRTTPGGSPCRSARLDRVAGAPDARQIFDPAELGKVIAVARKGGVRLHLDGARLFLEAAYARKDVAEYAEPFDTVYVSLYKYFNASFGAILAGPRELLDGLFHARRMFGGGLSQAWTSAAVALHYLDGFDAALPSGDRCVRRTWPGVLAAHRCFTVTASRRVPT